MHDYFDKKLIELAAELPTPLYAVGGFVRNYLIDKSKSEDVDLCAPLSVEDMTPYLERFGFKTVALYKRTGTIVFKANGIKYEFTSFRRDVYGSDGGHTPIGTVPTFDIEEDAKRRDFKCNAIYYDIKNGKIVDPLGGENDVKNRVLDTVVSPEKVFCFDGLRLMRLARFSAELNFKPTKMVLDSAKKYADNVKDISVERIYDELKKILVADSKYPFSDKRGHYTALKILDETRVLDNIIPELTLGRGMAQRSDYHKYDVLEHSLRCVLYAKPCVRLSALLHDVAKPFCMLRDGKYHFHGVEGVRIAEEVLLRLKADKNTIKHVKFLVGGHMLDLDTLTSKPKIRKFIVKNYPFIEDLMSLKQADYSAGQDDDSKCPTVNKWKTIIQEMLSDGTPFSLKDLSVNAFDLKNLGVKQNDFGKTLTNLWERVIVNPRLNEKDTLLNLVKNIK
ncbi:MAG: CCA tRNA nucleotidyltransferase [Clostridiales bacterium]|nr:CCA tRNA nucleotidyltransferase [Clostridiales bacterium]